MKNRVKWDCVFPNPLELDRNKYYDYKEDKKIIYVYGDKGVVFDYTIEQFTEFFVLENEE